MLIVLILATSLSGLGRVSGQHGTCLQGTSNCVCVADGCTDAGSGHDCIASAGSTNDTMNGYLCSAYAAMPGTGFVVPDGGFACAVSLLGSYSVNGGHAAFAQVIVGRNDLQPACGSGVLALQSRVYTDEDSSFTYSGNQVVIQHLAQGADGPVQEMTTIEFQPTGIAFSQQFVNVITGHATWTAAGIYSRVVTLP